MSADGVDQDPEVGLSKALAAATRSALMIGLAVAEKSIGRPRG